MHALDVRNGEVAWSHDLVEEYGSVVPRRGFAGSSLVEGDLLIVEAGGSDVRAFLAFDLKTGEQRWSMGEGPAGYPSGLVATIHVVRQMNFCRTRVHEVLSMLPAV